MRREPEFLDDCDAVLIYIARRLGEALRLEELLTTAGVDYVVEVDHYVGGFLFRRARAGAFFYVRPDAAPVARELMVRNGWRPFEAPG
ncbi:MAG: hypothetical protein RMK57_11490 [Bryobacterales bacterium]|nr:hypothetical protein [Bryobacteraceae bacterium]MDW8355142.1 hypothetical protein [Bryobacterales bacterium]